MKKLLHKISIKTLIEHNCHMGHDTRKRGLNANQYLIGTRNTTDIINLNNTLKALKNTLPIISNTIANNGKILIVSDNPICNDELKKQYKHVLQPIVLGKWTPGTLSNFKNIKESQTDIKNILGFSKIKRLPDLIIILSTKQTAEILNETNKLQIPVIAIVDSNDNPLQYTYTIPGNTDASEPLLFFFKLIKIAVLRGYTKQILSLQA